MKEDLKLMMDETVYEGTEEVTAQLETTTRTEYISSAYYAIAAVSELDCGLMPQEDRQRKRNILRKSLRIIDNVITELDAELFDEFEEDDYDY